MRRRRPVHSPIAASQQRFEVFVVDAFSAKNGNDGAARTRIGFAQQTEDRKGFEIELTALPVTGKLVMRLYSPQDV